MTPRGKKQEPKLALNMSFDDALERFIRTKPKEVEESIKRSKQARKPKRRKPPGSRPGGIERKKKT
jgi:hypothetical protein